MGKNAHRLPAPEIRSLHHRRRQFETVENDVIALIDLIRTVQGYDRSKETAAPVRAGDAISV
jgi:hypothetical protein